MPSQSSRTNSARINFGIPNSEYIVRVDADTGEALSCYNQDTDTEYINGGGGGGDSDFSTAEITYINSNTQFSAFYTVNAVIIEDDKIIQKVFRVDDEITVTVPLYKGKLSLLLGFNNIDEEIQPQFTGSIEPDEDWDNLIITGNGTITCAGITAS